MAHPEPRLRPAASLPVPAHVWQDIANILDLSPQQTRIVELILRGMRDQQIAGELRLKIPTVRTYLARIFQRLDVSDRLELVLLVFALSHRIARE